MLFVLQKPIVRSQSLKKVERKFQGAYDGSWWYSRWCYS